MKIPVQVRTRTGEEINIFREDHEMNLNSEHVPMHPDDFAGLMSWITAKRFRELGLEKTYREKPVYFRIL